jgi:hypothetical protein
MKKVLSFSLFGNEDIYCYGAIENAKLSSSIYFGWETRFYVSNDVPTSIIQELKKYNVTIIECHRKNLYDGLFWRFKPFYDDDVLLWISRDCDSRISHREKSCVDEWIESNKSAHIIRDSFNHSYEIMAGMFGINNVLFKQKYHVPNLIGDSSKSREDDQTSLTRVLWPIIINDHLCHDYWEHNLPKSEFLTFRPTDSVHFNEAYGCGVTNYVLYERKKRHSNLYLNKDNRNIPNHKKMEYGVYIGQRIDKNNNPIFDMDTRWEYELRGLNNLIK